MWLMMALSGVFIYRIICIVASGLDARRKRKMYPGVQIARKELLCKGPHSWDKTKLAIDGLPVESYTVCKDCGLISSSEFNYKLNPPGLEVYQNNLKRRVERQARWDATFKKKQEVTNLLMNNLIKENITKFDGDTQKNIENLQQFFRKSVIEIDSLYTVLNKEFEENGDG